MITFDLETLGSTFNAPIVQIAAVEFTPEGEVLGEFSVNIDISADIDKFTIDLKTVKWWMEQEKEAREAVFTDNGVPLKEALEKLMSWLGDRRPQPVWCHTTFDAPILKNTCIKMGFGELFNPYNYRDIRTLTALTGVKKTTVAGVAHNALDDCINQAKYISEAIRANQNAL